MRRLNAEMQLDPEVTKRTLGQPFDRVTPEAILATTKKLLAVSRGEAEPDDRDAMAYQQLMGPEDLFAERISKARNVLQSALWKATARRGVDHIPAGAMTKALQAALTLSGLGQALEEVNTAEILDHQARVTGEVRAVFRTRRRFRWNPGLFSRLSLDSLIICGHREFVGRCRRAAGSQFDARQ